MSSAVTTAAWCWVRRLLGYETGEKESCRSGEEHLLSAVDSGDVTTLLSLLQTDANVNAVNSQVRLYDVLIYYGGSCNLPPVPSLYHTINTV